MSDSKGDFEAKLVAFSQGVAQDKLREFYADLFERLNQAIEILPESRNKSIARTKLDECWQWLDWAVRYMWAGASPPDGLHWRHPNVAGYFIPCATAIDVRERNG